MYATKDDEALQNNKFKVVTSSRALVVKRLGKMEIYNKELKLRRKVSSRTHVSCSGTESHARSVFFLAVLLSRARAHACVSV